MEVCLEVHGGLRHDGKLLGLGADEYMSFILLVTNQSFEIVLRYLQFCL